MKQRLVAGLFFVLTLLGLANTLQKEIFNAQNTRASDALPLYLSAAAVSEGLDPTLRESLGQVYDERGMNVGAATFSTLYPATAGWLLQPLSALSWEEFTVCWRWMLVGAQALLLLAACWMGSSL